MDKEIKALAEQIQALNKQAFILYQPEVDALINAKIKDDKTIQRLLERILDFAHDAQILLLFKKMCRYYWTINPAATAEYVNLYREMWDSKNE
jgi:hypothetical protein